MAADCSCFTVQGVVGVLVVLLATSSKVCAVESQWKDVEAKMVAAGSTPDFVDAFKLSYDACANTYRARISNIVVQARPLLRKLL